MSLYIYKHISYLSGHFNFAESFASAICLIILPEIQQQADFPRWLPPQPQQEQQFNHSANLCGTKNPLSRHPQGISAAFK